MCGIVGACSRAIGVQDTLMGGLRSLEYRGYDSAGIVVHAPGLPRRRAQGRIDRLQECMDREPLPEGTTGIAHTRWATHGAPSDRNAHPHGFGKLMAVHNGILENWDALKEDFSSRFASNGSSFESETDSEVWVALVWDELGNKQNSPSARDMIEALARAMGRAKGSYGLAMVHEDLPGEVFFARQESPLVLGIGETGHYVASDISALLAHTRRFVYLEDGMLGRIWADGYEILDRSLAPQELSVDEVTWDAEQAEKGGYEHFMLKEIEEQPLVVARMLQSETSAEGWLLGNFEISDARLREFKRIVILACGTALHAARVAKYVIEECAGVPVTVDFASEFRYRNPMVGPGDLALAISQSGETADTLGAIKVAVVAGATPIAICNVRGSSLCRLAEATFLTECGPEIGVASTKAFTSQILAVHVLALRLAMARRRIDEAELMRRLEVLCTAPPAMEKMIHGAGSARDQAKAVAEKYSHKELFFFLGRGSDYPIALEGALKLKEISYVHAEGYPAGEMKHGPLALVSQDMVCVALCGDSPVYEKVLGNVSEVKARGGIIVAVTNAEKREVIELADDVILVPRGDRLITPLLNTIPLQYLAYYVALARGCDIDKPRNLAKSVTVE
ncbi:MAG: glutamine--fructose-6-phosphate transaminase (isomerizing) [Planctomycetes bacterium]|jgi:glucosamine--fructose-6-phosphate aminotransferase (isomerizing)|nr:glutamine--fructose-6-phosphate transaminase (isomerizing) [Planctomycetota bacterium]MDP6424976.1 glutamine--fructose-6-phosphate transaminase (isomerizing) [Planctomycetota bacterium]